MQTISGFSFSATLLVRIPRICLSIRGNAVQFQTYQQWSSEFQRLPGWAKTNRRKWAKPRFIRTFGDTAEFRQDPLICW
jgi:hypothetical protein